MPHFYSRSQCIASKDIQGSRISGIAYIPRLHLSTPPPRSLVSPNSSDSSDCLPPAVVKIPPSRVVLSPDRRQRRRLNRPRRRRRRRRRRRGAGTGATCRVPGRWYRRRPPLPRGTPTAIPALQPWDSVGRRIPAGQLRVARRAPGTDRRPRALTGALTGWCERGCGDWAVRLRLGAHIGDARRYNFSRDS